MENGCLRELNLETFLGGMETCVAPSFDDWAIVALKPSLVEWKQKQEEKLKDYDDALKPSLVEWKLFLRPRGPLRIIRP